MSRKSIRPPGYLFHEPSGQARVRINAKDRYLGPHGSPESKSRYDDLIHKWRRDNVSDDRHTTTIDDLVLDYMEHAKDHYVKNGEPTSEDRHKTLIGPVLILGTRHRTPVGNHGVSDTGRPV